MVLVWRVILRVLVIVMLGGILSATLVRLAPGFDSGEEDLDSRRGAGSLEQLRQARARDGDLGAFYFRFLFNYLRGDLGESRTYGRPVSELFAGRAGVTLAGLGIGVAAAWVTALMVTILAVRLDWNPMTGSIRGGATLAQCVPVSLLGLCLLVSGARGPALCGAAVAVVLGPRLVHYLLNLFQEGYALPHVVAARARGVGGWSVFFRHVAPLVWPQIVSLAGVSVALGVDAAVPLETILDVPGIGQLVWQAAIGRDLTLLVNTTMLVCVVITLANTLTSLPERHRGAACGTS